MRPAWRLKLLAARARRRAASARSVPVDREQVARREAAGRTFCDVGCIWKVDGRIAFLAEEAGATAVTGVDVSPPSARFEAERERRGSQVRFVQGDLHEEAVIAEVGPHQVVWCTGVLYHSPYPLLTLARLRAITTERLILQTMTIPELPGVRQGMVLYPGLDDSERRLYDLWDEAARASIAERVPLSDERAFAPWWWGITRSSLRSMLQSAGFEPEQEWGDPFSVHVIARPV